MTSIHIGLADAGLKLNTEINFTRNLKKQLGARDDLCVVPPKTRTGTHAGTPLQSPCYFFKEH